MFLPNAAAPLDPASVSAFDHQEPSPAVPASDNQEVSEHHHAFRRAAVLVAVFVGAASLLALLVSSPERSPTTSLAPASRMPPSRLPTPQPPPLVTGSPSESHTPVRRKASPTPSASESRAEPTRRPDPSPTARATNQPLAHAYVGTRSSLCLDVPDASRAEGTQLTIWPCHGGINQQFTHTVDGELRVYGDRCVTASGGAVRSAPVVVAPCTSDARQRWQLAGDGTIRQAGMCVDVTNGYNDPGTPIQIWDCVVSSNQQWSRVPPAE
ncbi:ricin-type beta-trefoil lectin domain protein [Streptomyces koelreuteriae]|uniref:RICIN domain-containing protein n=1 Tax=Streptomyces koelreuteriae TaxID=2838015 RepID=UPI003EB89AC6